MLKDKEKVEKVKEVSGGSLIDRIKKNSTLDHTEILTKSIVFNEKDFLSLDVPALNILLSGRLDGGLTPGLKTIAGPSKHFKTAFLLLDIRAFQKKFPDGVTIFYDSEFGAPSGYFDAFGIDKNKVLHCPITNIEEWKNDLASQLKNIKRGDHVFIAIDSVGNLASLKEVEDAEEGKTVTDMTRAKALKSVFRIATPHLTLKSIYMVVVAHVYQELGMFPKTILGGGTGIYLSSDTIWFVGRSKDKDGTDKKEVTGYSFGVRAEKSRYVKEGSLVTVKVTHDGGILPYSGLLDMALESGHIVKLGTKPLTYARVDTKTGEISKTTFTEDDLERDDFFWGDLFLDESFKEWATSRFAVAYKNILGEAGVTHLPVEEKK